MKYFLLLLISTNLIANDVNDDFEKILNEIQTEETKLVIELVQSIELMNKENLSVDSALTIHEHLDK